MRSASVGLTAAIDEECTTLARLWRVTRSDGTILRFTDADRPVTATIAPDVTPQVYRADVSFTTSAIFTSSTLASRQSVTLESMMDSNGFSEDDLRARKYDAAVGEVFLINYEVPTDGVLYLFRGNFGQVKIRKRSNRVTITLDPLGTQRAGKIGGLEVYSMTCRNSLGDANCGVDIDALKVAFTVDTVTDTLNFAASELNQANDHWLGGKVKWLTGDNAGTFSGVRTSALAGTTLTIDAEPLHPIAVGDTGEVFPGCDKIITTCRDVYNNLQRNRSEPFVPPLDQVPPRTMVGNIR